MADLFLSFLVRFKWYCCSKSSVTLKVKVTNHRVLEYLTLARVSFAPWLSNHRALVAFSWSLMVSKRGRVMCLSPCSKRLVPVVKVTPSE